MLTAVGGKAILGVNLESDSKGLASTEVADFDRYVGPSLIDAFELGDEPEFFPVALPRGHPPHDYADKIAHYGAEFTNIASALGGAPLAVPASGAPNWLSHLGTILRDLPSRLKLVTMHAYPMKNCSHLSQLSVPDFSTHASIQGVADSIHGLAHFYQFAVRAPNGSERVVLTNVGSVARAVGVTAAATRGTGSLSLLSAASLNAIGGKTLAGQSLSSPTGQLSGAARLT